MRKKDYVSHTLIATAILMMVVGYTRAQVVSQEIVTARLDERINASDLRAAVLDRKVDRLAENQTYGLYALIANLGAHFVQISGQKLVRRPRKKGEEEEES